MTTIDLPATALVQLRGVWMLLAFAAGIGLGFMAGAWSSQSAIQEQCSGSGTATAGEVAFECANVRPRGTAFR